MSRNRYASRGVNQRRRRRSHRDSFWGSLLLELIALATLMLLLAVHHGDEPSVDLATQPIEKLGSLASGYLADQLQQHPLLRTVR